MEVHTLMIRTIHPKEPGIFPMSNFRVTEVVQKLSNWLLAPGEKAHPMELLKARATIEKWKQKERKTRIHNSTQETTKKKTQKTRNPRRSVGLLGDIEHIVKVRVPRRRPACLKRGGGERYRANPILAVIHPGKPPRGLRSFKEKKVIWHRWVL